jgi:hypothetical protein
MKLPPYTKINLVVNVEYLRSFDPSMLYGEEYLWVLSIIDTLKYTYLNNWKRIQFCKDNI